MAALARRRHFHRLPHHFKKHHATHHSGSTIQSKAQSAERRMACAAAGGLIGYLESTGHLPVAVASVPSKLALGVVATIVQFQTSGSTARLAGALADASLATYAYAAAKKGAFIGADEDDEV